MATSTVSRTIKTYRAIVVDFAIGEDGNPAIIEGDAVEYTATAENDALARAAFKAAGNPQKRGTRFVHKLVSAKMYSMDFDKFIELADHVEDVPTID